MGMEISVSTSSKQHRCQAEQIIQFNPILWSTTTNAIITLSSPTRTTSQFTTSCSMPGWTDYSKVPLGEASPLDLPFTYEVDSKYYIQNYYCSFTFFRRTFSIYITILPSMYHWDYITKCEQREFLEQASLIGVYSLHMTTSYTMQVLTTVLQYHSNTIQQYSTTEPQYSTTIYATQFRCL